MSIPDADEVDAYLCRHNLEAVVDEAVNDAVLKQVAVSGARQSQMTTIVRGAVPARVRVSMCVCACVYAQDPYAHIAMMLMKHSVKPPPEGVLMPRPQAHDHNG